MKKPSFFLLSIIVFSMLFTIASCTIFHKCSFDKWTVIIDPTVTKCGQEKSVCSCGKSETREVPAIGVSKVKNLLQGSWKSDIEHVYIKFTGDTFVAGLFVGNKEYDLLTHKGSYSVTDTTIELIETNGNVFGVFTFNLLDQEIKLYAPSGAEFSKY